MSRSIKCSDYFIVKLRYYADEKVLKKHYADPNHANLPLPKQHRDRARDYYAFFWVFVERVTGKSSKYWWYQFMTDASGCVRDEIQDRYGILISDTEGWVVYMIPKKHKDLFDWVIQNATVPYKEMKKVNLGAWSWSGLEANTWRREDSKQHTKKMKEKYPQLKNESYEQG